MMYLVVILIAVLLLAYFGGRWLAHEAREGVAALRKTFRRATGGQTPENLIREARVACAGRGLEPDLIAVPSDAETAWDALRRHVLGRIPAPELPAAACFVFAVDVERATAYLRAAWAPPGAAGVERTDFLAFEEIAEIRSASLTPHPAIHSPATAVLEIVAAPDGVRYRLPIEPAWGVAPHEFAEHVQAMVRSGRKPAGGAVILR